VFHFKILPVWLSSKIKLPVHQALCMLLIAGMAVKGWKNLQHQQNIMGEYSNPNLEQLFHWIETSTKRGKWIFPDFALNLHLKHFLDAVFAGTMPTMANLKLSTGRPIVNHPHYEDAELRERTIKVYSMFSRKTHTEVYALLKHLGVQYYVFEYGWCKKSGKWASFLGVLYYELDFEKKINLGQDVRCQSSTIWLTKNRKIPRRCVTKFKAGNTGRLSLSLRTTITKCCKFEIVIFCWFMFFVINWFGKFFIQRH